MNDEIANLIGYWDWENKTANQCADAILSLPTLKAMMEDAGKWRKVEEIAASEGCEQCVVKTPCAGASHTVCSVARGIISILKETP